ncbi:MAG: S-layer homology domain-containing protein [Candidatus Aminicenantes bacterium]|nr:S-layer homology domain-containing protein [Candidatus Aminicenantes bacterium]
MVKKAIPVYLVLTFLCWSCSTYSPPSLTLYVEQLPQSVIGEMSLEERILTEEAWKNLGQGDGDKAKKALIKLGQESPLYYAGLGYALFLLDDIQKAEEFFKAALLTFPDLILIHVGLAQIYQKTGREDSAFSEFRNIIKLDPDHPWAKSRYETIKSQIITSTLQEAREYVAAGETEKSKASYLKVLFYSPASIEAHFALAGIYKEEKNFQSALVHLKAASTFDPENSEILHLYGDVLFTIQDHKKSLEIYEKLSLEEPDNPQIKGRLEIIKSRLGIFELPSQYGNIPNSEAVTREDLAAVIGVKFKDYLEDPAQQPLIIIDIATSWAAKFILKMTTLGLIDVYPNHEFQPKKILSRAELAEILVRLIMHLEEKGHKFIQQIPLDRIQIVDVTSSNYYYQPILTIISYDIMSLFSDKTFKPDSPITGRETINLFDIILALIE